MRFFRWCSICWLLTATSVAIAADDAPQFDRDIVPLLKRHCVKCHGLTKQEGKLNLAAASAIVRGGKSGAAVVPHDADASLIWQKVTADEMPPDMPLSADEKAILKRWIAAGTVGLKRDPSSGESDHWAFRVLPKSIVAPSPTAGSSPLDSFIASELATDGLTISPVADRATLIRRVSFDLTGLPPDVEAIREFQSDQHPDAYERMVDRYLASPHFGERLGKVWLDAAGYADSNGYFSADSDRPLAYRYRDYVIRAINADRPFHQFVREQIAGDEIAGLDVKNGGSVELSAENLTSRGIDLFEATHYLRCGQDGTGESDGNPDEVRVDRYTVLETAMQNVSTGLMGLTIQCAKCHDHKFEPLTQRDYYGFQAVLIPAFPPEQWVKPNDRFVYATLPGEVAAWEGAVAKAEADVQRLSKELGDWTRQHRPRGNIVFADGFDDAPEALMSRWSHTAPGDDAPGGTAAVNLNSRDAPAAIVVDGRLEVIEGGPGGDKWLSTREAFDWTPDVVGASIQVTFDLVDHHVDGSKPAERIGYLIALHDFNDNSQIPGGNILIDGHPSSSSAVYVDYPGTDSRQAEAIGKSGHVPGRNYGVRITNQGDGKFVLQHLVDWQIEEKSVTLTEADLPNGGFGFEYCCSRSFVVDNVSVETLAPAEKGSPQAEFRDQLKARRAPLDEAQKRKGALGTAKPGRIAWTTDVVPPPKVNVLLRGNYKTPGDPVEAAGFAVLGPRAWRSSPQPESKHTTGRRLEFADWITEPNSPRSSLLARVQINRLWQHLFGTGIVATPDNFGLSGAPPSHPELLDWLAATFVQSDWSAKHVVRHILRSSTYRQQSATDDVRLKLDPDLRRLSRYPVRRLDAEAIRDSLLAMSGDLDDGMYGAYIQTSRNSSGETIVPEDNPGSRRRSIYLQQKRTQIHSLLQVFDAPSIVFNSTRRARSTMPLQSLSLLNSEFVVARSKSLASQLQHDLTSDSDRIQQLFLLTTGHDASEDDVSISLKFLKAGSEGKDANSAWMGLSHALMVGNAALYVD